MTGSRTMRSVQIPDERRRELPISGELGLQESVGMRRPQFFHVIVALTLLAVFFAPRAAHAAPGDVKWRFEVGGQYILQPPAVAPDGSVAVVGSSGRLYSLTPDGALRWSVPGVGGEGGPSIGSDGTVYVGLGERITAVAPDGTIRWTFIEPTVGQGVIAGPTVGPDGNIYVVSDLGGLGAYALSPAGDLLWNNPGDPNFLEYGQLGAEIVFGSGRLFASFDEFPAEQTAMMYALTVGGTQDWAVAVPDANDIFMQRQAQPAVGPGGGLYLTGLSGPSGRALVRFDQSTGSVVWTYTQSPANGMSPPSSARTRPSRSPTAARASRRRSASRSSSASTAAAAAAPRAASASAWRSAASSPSAWAGRSTLADSDGGGTRFTLILPRSRGTALGPEAAPLPRAGSAS